jgi:hypothetical protein
MVFGRVADRGQGVPGVFVSAGFLGNTATDSDGKFALRVPRGGEYRLELSRTGYLIRPAILAGVASIPAEIDFEALTLMVNGSSCKPRDMVGAKVSLGNALLKLLETIPTASNARSERLRNGVRDASARLVGVPEVFMDCGPQCVQADLSRALDGLKKSIQRVRKQTESAVLQANRNGLTRRSPWIPAVRAIVKTLTREPKRFPRFTSICR